MLTNEELKNVLEELKESAKNENLSDIQPKFTALRCTIDNGNFEPGFLIKIRDLLIIYFEPIKRSLRNLYPIKHPIDAYKPPMTFTGTLQNISYRIRKEIETPMIDMLPYP